MPATLRNDVYDRLVDRLRHAEQYAEAARRAVQEARSAQDVIAMMAAPDERAADQLLHVEQYAEAAVRAVQDAIALLEEVIKEGRDA